MALSLHTTKTYKVEYGQNAINGYEDIDKFIKFLSDKRFEQVEGIWIDEDETYIEIDFSTLAELAEDETWGEVIKTIIEQSDKSNNYARLEIW